VHQLFVAEVVPADEEVQLVMQMTLEGIKAHERDPLTTYANRVRELNYGNSYYFKVSFSRFGKWNFSANYFFLFTTPLAL